MTSEFIELDLGEFKLLFNKKDWRQVEDLFEKNRLSFVPCYICCENCDTNNIINNIKSKIIVICKINRSYQ